MSVFRIVLFSREVTEQSSVFLWRTRFPPAQASLSGLWSVSLGPGGVRRPWPLPSPMAQLAAFVLQAQRPLPEQARVTHWEAHQDLGGVGLRGEETCLC